MTTGEKITMQRKIRGMSQEALANEMDVTRQAVSRWETGDAMPDTDKVIKLSRLFDVSTDYLLLDDADDIESIAAPMPAPDDKARTERQRVFRIVTGICTFAAGIACVVTALVLAYHFAETTTWFLSDVGEFGTGLFHTGIAWPFWIGALLFVCGAAILVREYLRRD